MIGFLGDFVTVVWALRAWVALAAFLLLGALWVDEVARRKQAELDADRLREANYRLRALIHPSSRAFRPIVRGPIVRRIR